MYKMFDVALVFVLSILHVHGHADHADHEVVRDHEPIHVYVT